MHLSLETTGECRRTRTCIDRTPHTFDYTTITLPYSYAMLLTAHTYYTSVFLARDPVFSVQGRHSESQTAETAVASLLDYQLISGGQLPALFLWLMDPGRYGVSIIGHYWDGEVFTFSQMAEVPRELFGMPIPGTSVKKLISVEQEGYVGNRLYNVRPQDFFHDPSVPILRFQEGEFCIVYNDTPWVKVAKRAADGMYFNIRNLKETGKSRNRDMTACLPARVGVQGRKGDKRGGDCPGCTTTREESRRHPAVEELIAEMSAAFLCADLGITPEVREDHAAYRVLAVAVL